MKNKLNGVFSGKINKKYNMISAIDKTSIKHEVYLSHTGLAEDECAEEKFHGGLERALHHYPAEHYSYWQEKYGIDAHWRPPGMGENISTLGMTEREVYIGQRFNWGEAVIEVSQPRSPCFKVNKRWGVEDVSLSMQNTGRCGWLYRVIQPGMVSVDEPLVSQGLPADSLTVYEVLDYFFNDPLNIENLKKLSQLKPLADEWKDAVIARLESQKVENWQGRLFDTSVNT